MALYKAFICILLFTINASLILCQTSRQLDASISNREQSTLPSSLLQPTNFGGPPTFSTLQSSTISPAATQAMLQSFRKISEGAQQFSMDLFTKFSEIFDRSNAKADLMISPFSVWALLLLLVEGSAGNTLNELRKTLHIDTDQQALRNAFSVVQKYLTINTNTIEVASLQAVFSDINQPVDRDFESVIERYYGSVIITTDFHDVVSTFNLINKLVKEATRGLINHTVSSKDLENANSFLVSSLFFKGQWKYPFNRTITRPEMFYDESGNPIGEVSMMVQEANFNFAGINELEAHVLELPYGKENRLSMLVILPRKGVTTHKVVQNLRSYGISNIFQKLNESKIGYEEENVEVLFPKFSTSSDFKMMPILQEMGMNDIFDPAVANLSKISNNFFVSSIIHTTKIVVDEEGTTAAAITGSVLANKATPPKFYLNRPFIYLIMEKKTNLLLFAGWIKNPNNYKY
ncbi:serine protease inhibitor 77Ba [Teleopsis dalmanni]|uniref:serine protease inhibitor 77Ba n=1 Tax=Teleopsis dalmanni TaxID=139649 RepID=UPI0018CD4368|nr:serine protease inhibitor 77Ba [Teleopsis dalmanni]